MKAKFPKILLAASFCAFGFANAGAPPTGASGDGRAPQPWERCTPGAAASRDKGAARFDERFKQLDVDRDGSVSKAEAEKGAPPLAERFGEIDANEDGKLTPEEMRGAMRARAAQCRQDPDRCRAEMKQRFEAAWQRADTDGDGTLSKAEAARGMPRLALRFDQIDTDRDGRLTPAEVDATRAARHPHPRPVPQPDAAPPSAPQGG